MKPPRLAPLAGALLALVAAGCSDSKSTSPTSSPSSSSAPADGGQDPGGLWHPVRQAEAMSEEFADLAALPYLGGSAEIEASAVARYDLESAWDGLNLVVSAHAAEASVRDMKGNVLQTWTADPSIWSEVSGVDPVHKTYLRRAHMLPTGDLLAIFEGIGMVKLTADSKLVWKWPGRAHHDLCVDDAGTIYTLARGDGGEDFVVTLSSAGKETSRVSIFECLGNSTTADAKPKSGKATDANTIEILDGSALGKKGQVLVSLGATDTVVVLDLGAKKATWAKTGPWNAQHQPTVTDSGTLLVFDNQVSDGVSRVVEIDPASGEILWDYEGSDFTPLWSAGSGSCQRLANDNILITESEAGRAFEVTRDKDVAWEFLSPYANGKLVANLCEIVRLDREYVKRALPGAVADEVEIDTGDLDKLLNNKDD